MNAQSGAPSANGQNPDRADMVWIEGGTFTMGSDAHYAEERPSRPGQVEGFWIDRTPVTNREFARFVDETGYVTFAERAPLAEDYPGAPVENLQPGSMVFTPPPGLVDLNGPPAWWAFIPGADWRHPLGPDSSIDGLETHPVVQVALVDVEAYAAWAEASLPTEAEWEFAAQGSSAREFAWGDELEPGGAHMANVWQGAFPYNDRGDDGWKGTSPVGSYPANGFGLHDMIGNVWEWTADWWTTPQDRTAGKKCCSASRLGSACADDPLHIPRRVLKGGSHLCAPNYCRRYRPAARHAHPVDTSTSHVGFRCIRRPQ